MSVAQEFKEGKRKEGSRQISLEIQHLIIWLKRRIQRKRSGGTKKDGILKLFIMENFKCIQK